MPTTKIKDVAKLAGVSTATVSRTLSRPETVAEETRKLVLEAAQRSGYRVNLAARSLRSQRAGAVVVLLPNIGNTFFSQILAGIEATLADEGLSVLVIDTQQSNASKNFPLNQLHPGRADGIICLDGSLSPSFLQPNLDEDQRLPLVFACEWPDEGNCAAVRVHNRAGAHMAVRHLVSLGHEKIGYIEGPRGNVLSFARNEGVLEAFFAHGIEHKPEWFFTGDFTMVSGAKAADTWLKMSDRPTAVFCANDESAVGFMSRLHQVGVDVPGDVSVVGFDDVEVSQHFIPPLTTVRQPRMEIGRRAAKILLEQIAKPQNSPLPKEVLEVEFVERKSTGAPASQLTDLSDQHHMC